MKLIKIILASTLALSSVASAASMLELRQAEKLAITLTGKPLTSDLRAKFLKGEIDLKTIADQLSTGPEFIENFAEYWTRTLNIQAAVNPYALKSLSAGKTLKDIGNYLDWSFIAYPPNAVGADVNGLTGFYNARASGATPPAIEVRYCDDLPTLTIIAAYNGRNEWKALGTTGKTSGGAAVKAGTEEIWSKLWDLWQKYDVECGSGGTVMLPWWDPDGVTINAKYKGAAGYRVPPMILQACGEGLKKCSLKENGKSDAYMDEVSRAMTMEASYIISHIVAEDTPFNEILTTEKTIMTGAYGYFMSRDRGSNMWGNFPGGGYVDLQNPVFKTTKPNDKNHYWVNRNPLHSGILTTPVFQLLTNGRRAKANKAYETFLCKKFAVPEGAKPDPADANPDLTQRTYCSYCHKSIEPMAAFFNRWPQTGVNNYQYDDKQDEAGRFAGISGEGAKGLGKILAENSEFQTCSIRRAFEFVNRRKMSYLEEENKLDEYASDFASDKNLRRLIIKMLLEPEFLSPKGATP